MEPYLIMVLVGYAAFVGVLGAVWLRQYVSDVRAPRAAASEAGKKRDADEFRKAA
jgi:hypothetical protein